VTVLPECSADWLASAWDMWDGRFAIRASVSNWSTTQADIDRLAAALSR
jgi:hypothetical protein